MCDYEKNQLPDTCDYEGTCLECVKFHIVNDTLPTCLDLAGIKKGRLLYYKAKIKVVKCPTQCPPRSGEKCGHKVGDEFDYPIDLGRICTWCQHDIKMMSDDLIIGGEIPILVEGLNRRERREKEMKAPLSCIDKGLTAFEITREYIPEGYKSDWQ